MSEQYQELTPLWTRLSHMSRYLQRIMLTCVLFGFATGCTTGVIGGKPQLPLSDKHGTARILTATERQTVFAITNAFAEFSYRGMALHSGAESEDILSGNDTTDSFVLRAMHEPIARVPLDVTRTKWVPTAITIFRLLPIQRTLTCCRHNTIG